MVAAGQVARDAIDVTIWRLRAENGLPWRRIAEVVDRDQTTVRQRWERMLRDSVPIARVESLLAEQNESIDVLLAEALVIARGQEMVARAVPVRGADGRALPGPDGNVRTEIVEAPAYVYGAKDRIQAIRAAVQLLKRRADLNGLDAPKRVEVEDVTPRSSAVVMADFTDLVAKIRQHAGMVSLEGEVGDEEDEEGDGEDEKPHRRPFLALG
jgi:hypothetical protein